MTTTDQPEVAILLATYNGARFVEQQIRSFTGNATAFTLHWLDDHSTDNTREVVRVMAERAGIKLKEYHQGEHLGVPAAFFQLMECVEADLYLFSDQDDIWQPGKIDAAVASLRPHIAIPVLCFTDALMFRNNDTRDAHRFFAVVGAKAEVALQESRLFMGLALGHTEAFTRALRDIYMRHKEIARAHAFMHDLWMYDIAIASGGAWLLKDAPTTLYRSHITNTSKDYTSWKGKGTGYLAVTQQQHHLYRRCASRHARGFILAAPTLPQGPKLERLLEVARQTALLDQRQTAISVIRLLRHGLLWPSRRLAVGLALACLWSDAYAPLRRKKPEPAVQH